MEENTITLEGVNLFSSGNVGINGAPSSTYGLSIRGNDGYAIGDKNHNKQTIG